MGVETALAIGGLAVTAYSTYNSFSEAEKAKSLQNQAASDAAKAMEEARKKLDINVYEQIGLDNRTYEEQLLSNVAAATQLTEAGKESERGAAAIAGKVFAGLTEAQQQIGQEKRAEVQRLKEITAKEEADLLNQKAQLDVSEAGAMRLKERDAQRAAAMYEQQGWQGVTSAVGQAAQLVPLYLKQRQPKLVDMQTIGYKSAPTSNDLYAGTQIKSADMTEQGAKDMLSKMTPEEQAQLFNLFQSNPFKTY